MKGDFQRSYELEAEGMQEQEMGLNFGATSPSGGEDSLLQLGSETS